MTNKERLEEIKNGYFEWLHGLFGTSWVSMPKENFEWLIQQAEKAQMYEDTLKFCQFQLKNGGKGKRTRITNAVDKALENNDYRS